ncbi:MAG: hypothetical protein ACSHW7_08110 [Patiriisocius sp.]|uniref:hypothetical protein n=1 Tax=Patiriisocius sp. TaxID=2822396 RepID=UPI003EF389C5
MEQIKIFFFALVSFFGIEDGRIAAEKTTVTVYPKTNEIEIVQEDLFTVLEREEDASLAVKQWNTLANWEEDEIVWAKALDGFAARRFTIKTVDDNILPHLKFTYHSEQDLRAMGIWYNEERNQFSINHIPRNNMKTENGALSGNYWVFDGDEPFSFTIEPFMDMPDKFKNLKKSLKELLVENKED